MKGMIVGWCVAVTSMVACSGEVNDADDNGNALAPEGPDDSSESNDPGANDDDSETPSSSDPAPQGNEEQQPAPNDGTPSMNDPQPEPEPESMPEPGTNPVNAGGNGGGGSAQPMGNAGSVGQEPSATPTSNGGNAAGGEPNVPEPEPQGAGGASQEPDVPIFMALYEVCGPCHGDQGQGVSGKGPELQHPDHDHFEWVVRNGDADLLPQYDEPMTAWSTDVLADQYLEEMIAWLQSLPKPTDPGELFADYCANCHGADGRGGPDTYVSAYHSAPFTRRRGADFINYVRSGHLFADDGTSVPISDRAAYMPPVPPSMLSDQELSAIEAWLPQ